MRRILLIASCAFLLAGCSNDSTATPAAHPSGWSEVKGKSGMVYAHGGQTFLLQKTSFDGTIKDFASALTTSVVLQNHEAKFLQSLPLPGCPGEAGLQIFDLTGAKPRILEAAFTVRDNTAISVLYMRPRSAADDPNVRAAMKQDVCSPII